MSLDWTWHVEWYGKTEAAIYAIRRVHYWGKTKYQTISIVDIPLRGKALIIDGKIQSALGDEWIYHEALVHPPMILHPNPKKILVLGGGEGATIREVLKHKTVEEVVMVDIDEEMINVARKYLTEWHQGSFDDPRVKLVIKDGREYLKEKEDEYDVIIIDLTDPVKDSPSMYLYTKEFYQLVFKALKNDGVFVTQSTQMVPESNVYAVIHATVKAVFPIVRLYRIFVPVFLQEWSFVLGSKTYDPDSLSIEDIEKRIKARIKEDLRLYDGEAHLGMFNLPKYVRQIVGTIDRISTDDNPIYLPI
ncbi:MAG: spermidine synthase [Thermoprotei archaeon]|nr:MAG: spermidine synthase [Thermoprotei archaeon]